MSLFKHCDIDKILVEYISFDDAVVLSRVNKYYYNATKNILAPLRRFNKNKIILGMNIPTDFGTLVITSNYLESYDPITRVVIQAHIYGNLDVIKHITTNNKHVNTSKVVTLMCETKTSIDTQRRNVITILGCIAISYKRLDILSFVVNHYGCDNLELKYDYFIPRHFVTSDYTYPSAYLKENVLRIINKN